VTEPFNAIVAHRDEDGTYRAGLEQVTLADLPDEDVLIDVDYSTLNFKDGLAVTGKGRICERFPMVCGIDLAGTVAQSRSPRFQPGDQVVVNGFGLSQSHFGGYSQRARVRSDFLVKLPDAFTTQQAMAIGTAGYTAMLCVLALERHDVVPGAGGEVLVTGAAGGVGSVAIAILAGLGHRVIAATGRPETHDYLRDLGAGDFVDRADLAKEPRPIGRERWAAAIDTVGSTTLANVLAQIAYGGTVAACGLAGGADLPASVLPFILRGVTLAGVDSVMAPMARREEAWARLANDLDRDKLAAMTRVEAMSRVPELAPAILKGEVRGRIVIDVNA